MHKISVFIYVQTIFVIFLSSICRFSLSQSYEMHQKNCLIMHRNCDNSQNNCQLDIIIMKKMCGDYFNDDTIFEGCNRKNELSCKGAIKTMRTKHNFVDCNCDSSYNSPDIDNKACGAIWRMINQHPCMLKPPKYLPEDSTTEDRKVSEIEISQKTDGENHIFDPSSKKLHNDLLNSGLRVTLGSFGLFAETDVSKPVSCIARQEMCHQDHNCYSAWNNFRANCQFHTCDKTGDQCISSYEVMRHFNMFECTCVQSHREQAPNMKICLEIQSSLLENKCLAFLNNRLMYQTLVFSTTEDNRRNNLSPNTMPKQIQSIQREAPNCHDTYSLCVKSPPCLQRYIEIEKNCSSCKNYSTCLTAVRSFYSKPDLISLNSIRCQCDRTSDNDSCQRQQQVFQPACVKGGLRPTSNCLLLMLTCLKDTPCLDSYTVFTQLCSVDFDRSSKCSNHYFRCLDAYRTIWGSILTKECSCDASETMKIAAKKYSWSPDPVKTCQFFQKILSKPYCLFSEENQSRKESNKTQISVSNANDPCSIALKHKLPIDRFIRLESNSNCPLVCKCGQKCQALSCSSTNMSFQSVCRLFNHTDIDCDCSEKGIDCKGRKLGENDWKYQDSGYKLLITYDKREFSIIRLSDFLYGIDPVIESLNTLMSMSTGLKHCRLTFQSAQKTYISLVLEINVQTSEKKNQFSLKYWPPSEDERINHLTAECVLSAKLLQLMINRKYPEIQHSLPLSILQRADIIVPPELPQMPQLSKPQNSDSSNHASLFKFPTNLSVIIVTVLFSLVL